MDKKKKSIISGGKETEDEDRETESEETTETGHGNVS